MLCALGLNSSLRELAWHCGASLPAQGKIVYTTANTDISDIRRFLMEPGPRNGPILCHIRREKGAWPAMHHNEASAPRLGGLERALSGDPAVTRRYANATGKLGYPYYALYLEAAGVQPGSDEGERFLLSARKRKKSKTSNYLISIDLEDTHRKVRAAARRARHADTV